MSWGWMSACFFRWHFVSFPPKSWCVAGAEPARPVPVSHPHGPVMTGLVNVMWGVNVVLKGAGRAARRTGRLGS